MSQCEARVPEGCGQASSYSRGKTLVVGAACELLHGTEASCHVLLLRLLRCRVHIWAHAGKAIQGGKEALDRVLHLHACKLHGRILLHGLVEQISIAQIVSRAFYLFVPAPLAR